jgi:hypothetical protein
MKWSDFFKKLGINMEDEISDTSTETVKVDKEIEKNDASIPVKEVIDNIEKEEEVKKMVLPKYDEKTGLFSGLNDLDNEDLKALLKSVNTSVKTKANQEKINGAIKTKIDTLKLIDGVSSDVIMKLLDTTNIKVQDDEVVGINEAFDNLVKSQAGLFKANKETVKEEPSPMLEGFSKPMDKNSPFSEDDIVALAYGQE